MGVTEMIMTSRTKQSDDDIVEAFYGINRSTFEVERVWLTRGGALSKSTKDGGSFQHRIEHGRDARNEAFIVFNLIDIFSVCPQYENIEETKRRTTELEAKATQMRAKAAES